MRLRFGDVAPAVTRIPSQTALVFTPLPNQTAWISALFLLLPDLVNQSLQGIGTSVLSGNNVGFL